MSRPLRSVIVVAAGATLAASGYAMVRWWKAGSQREVLSGLARLRVRVPFTAEVFVDRLAGEGRLTVRARVRHLLGRLEVEPTHARYRAGALHLDLLPLWAKRSAPGNPRKKGQSKEPVKTSRKANDKVAKSGPGRRNTLWWLANRGRRFLERRLRRLLERPCRLGDVDLVLANYALEIEEGTFAGRPARHVGLVPRREKRPAQTWWIDRETGIPLEVVRRGIDGSRTLRFALAGLRILPRSAAVSGPPGEKKNPPSPSLPRAEHRGRNRGWRRWIRRREVPGGRIAGVVDFPVFRPAFLPGGFRRHRTILLESAAGKLLRDVYTDGLARLAVLQFPPLRLDERAAAILRKQGLSPSRIKWMARRLGDWMKRLQEGGDGGPARVVKKATRGDATILRTRVQGTWVVVFGRIGAEELVRTIGSLEPVGD